jgi:phage terminase large subunit
VTVAQELDINYTASVEGVYIPSQWVTACIDAHLRIEGMTADFLPSWAGLDVATEGSNKTVLIVRAGGVVLSIQEWQGTDTTQTSFRVHDYMVTEGIELLTFDADGVGAGVAGTLASIADKPYWVEVFHGAGSPNEHLYWEGEKKTSKQKFANKRAEAWGLVRERIKKTYEVVSGIKEHPADELISIPNDGELITQLSQPVVKYNASGKILLESKQDLRKRGLSSPDKADALALAFYPSTNLGWMNEL